MPWRTRAHPVHSLSPRGAPLLLGLLLTPLIGAEAHGIWGHVHVTGWAVENMPDDDLRAFLLEPEVFNALLFGAAFTDSGYAANGEANRAYSEHTHWEPFIQDYIAWIQANDPPPWDSLESKKRVAFLLGCASHGLQDSLFDSLFLYHAEERDGADQDATDPGTDGFLVMDEHVRFVPEQDLPMTTLLELYGSLEPPVTEDVILNSVGLMTSFYVNDTVGLDIARSLGEGLEAEIPWTRTHYLDPEIPGSLRAEIFPTMHYQQAIWKRLHGDFSPDEATVHTFPERPRRLLTGDPSTAGSWASLVFGAGVHYRDDLLRLTGPDGPVDVTQQNTRWGAEYTRLIRLLPEETLVPGGWYTLELEPVDLIDGTTATTPFTFDFQVTCDEDAMADCPDQSAAIQVAHIDGLPQSESPKPASPPSCGCDVSGGHPASLVLMGLLAGLGLRQRRRPD